MIVKIITHKEASKLIPGADKLKAGFVGGYDGGELICVMPFHESKHGTEVHIYGHKKLMEFCKIAVTFIKKPLFAEIKNKKLVSLAKRTGFKQFDTIGDNILMRLE